MTWLRVCPVEDLPPLCARTFDAGGVSVALARSGDTVFALENRCSHDDGPLGEGRLAAGGAEIECPRHGARFDLATGRPSRMPAVSPIERFPAKVEGGGVWVDVREDDA